MTSFLVFISALRYALKKTWSNRHVDWSNDFLAHNTMQSFLFIMFYLDKNLLRSYELGKKSDMKFLEEVRIIFYFRLTIGEL